MGDIVRRYTVYLYMEEVAFYQTHLFHGLEMNVCGWLLLTEKLLAL